MNLQSEKLATATLSLYAIFILGLLVFVCTF